MLSLTRKTDYAVVAMSHLAHQGGRVSARLLAERLGLPLPALMNVLNQLGRSGLVDSQRGPNGGYGLARSAGEISLADLICAVEGPVQLTHCCEETPVLEDRRCDLETGCAVKTPIRRVNEVLRSFLESVSLDQIASNSVPVDLSVKMSDSAALGATGCSCGSGEPVEGEGHSEKDSNLDGVTLRS